MTGADEANPVLLFSSSFRTRARIQLRDAVLQDVLPGRQKGLALRRRNVSGILFISFLMILETLEQCSPRRFEIPIKKMLEL